MMTDGRRRVLHVIVVIVILAAFWWNQERGLKAVAVETHSTLCAVQENANVQVKATKDFIDKNPNGVISPKTGAVIFSRAELDASLKRQRDFARALRGLEC